ncbi:hypothetical protein ACFY8B_35735 [Streptomyces sp. NPDC012751]|uniref:hypothetical protein n=1 Tax=Streptomyces sp. NPDC012751 TaxID=3364846 RepID=UPI00369DDCC2
MTASSMVLEPCRLDDPPAHGAVLVSRVVELHGDQSTIQSSIRLARLFIRTTATALCWAGDVLWAVEVGARLVSNGVRHGMPAWTPKSQRRLVLSVAVTDTDALVTDVSDMNPLFPDFPAAARGEKGRGLQQVALLGARVEWFLPHVGVGKTVRAVMPLHPHHL